MKRDLTTLSRRGFIGLGAAGASVLAAGCSAGTGAGSGSAAGSASAESVASIVFRNGTIQTMVSEDDTAEALAVAGNKIVYVGDDAGVEDWIGEDTEVIDLDGGMVIPGFMDGHIHAPGDWLTKLYEIDLSQGTTIEEYKQIISDFVEANPDDEAYTGHPFRNKPWSQ